MRWAPLAAIVLDCIGVGSAMLVGGRLGAVAWLAAAAHEIPQELGDFGVLLHGGWKPRRALLFFRGSPS